jgi:YbbR domain-containing protein
VDLRKNLSLKLAALGIAFGLWIWVSGQADVLKTVRVPLDVADLPAGLEIVSDIPDDVTVRLRGPEIALRTLDSERVRVHLRLDSPPVQVGINHVPIPVDQVRVPAGIDIDRISPNVIDLNIQRRAAREVPIHPDVRGQPAHGFELAGTSVDPPTLTIEGPEAAVRTVSALATPAISIDSLSADETIRVRPIASGPAAAQVRLANPDATVAVQVRIRPEAYHRTLAGIRILAVGGRPPQPIFRPSVVSVDVSGPPDKVGALSSGDLVAIVDLTALPASARDLLPSQLEVRPGRTAGVDAAGLRFRVVSSGPIRMIGRVPGARP